MSPWSSGTAKLVKASDCKACGTPKRGPSDTNVMTVTHMHSPGCYRWLGGLWRALVWLPAGRSAHIRYTMDVRPWTQKQNHRSKSADSLTNLVLESHGLSELLVGFTLRHLRLCSTRHAGLAEVLRCAMWCRDLSGSSTLSASMSSVPPGVRGV